MNHRENTQTLHHIFVDGTCYELDAVTAALLKNGIVAPDLYQKIMENHGEDVCYDFCRQRSLMKKANDMISAGELSEELKPLIDSGDVPAPILYRLCQKTLLEKAKSLWEKHLLSESAYEEMCSKILTRNVLPALSNAFLMESALLLHSKDEIDDSILQGLQDGTIERKYLLVILRDERHSRYQVLKAQGHSIQDVLDDHGCVYRLDNLSDKRMEPEAVFVHKQAQSYLQEALDKLDRDDYKLICYLYDDRLSLRAAAKRMKISDRTARRWKKRILASLRKELEGKIDSLADYLSPGW